VEAGISDVASAKLLVDTGLAPSCLRILTEPRDQDLENARSTTREIVRVLTGAGVTLSPLVLHGYENTGWGAFR
jgi:hypothetical protein